MIRLKATVRGEPDVPAFTRIFDYDEEIFFSSAKIIQEKIERKMKINANEALLAYCALIVRWIQAGNGDNSIKDKAQKILSVENVTIGVPETLRLMMFDVTVDDKPARKIVLRQPIPTGKYMLVD